MRLDATGKVTLDHIYTQPDPRPYFATLRQLDYHIPQLAKPYFQTLFAQHRAAHRGGVPQVLDIGSSYGINAALLRCDLSMEQLYDRYAGAGADSRSREELLALDRKLVAADAGRIGARFVGLDVSRPALTYAEQAGFLDDVVLADLERADPTERQRARLADTDVVISTGCLGYVGAKTITRVVKACAGRRPWMAHFVLRMFPFEPIEQALTAYGYHTLRVDRLFRQRRFASADEQSQVLDRLSAVGVDPSGLESDGWFYAQLYVSRPRLAAPATTARISKVGQ